MVRPAIPFAALLPVLASGCIDAPRDIPIDVMASAGYTASQPMRVDVWVNATDGGKPIWHDSAYVRDGALDDLGVFHAVPNVGYRIEGRAGNLTAPPLDFSAAWHRVVLLSNATSARFCGLVIGGIESQQIPFRTAECEFLPLDG